MSRGTAPDSGTIELSVVAPAHNEEGNITELVRQVHAAVAPTGMSFEFIVVDDGSTDKTREVLRSLMPDRPWLRCVAMRRTTRGKGNGQSAAFFAGFRGARGNVIAVLDADLQNDAAEIPAMLGMLKGHQAHMVQGDRTANRRDSAVRRAGSLVGRVVRRWLLGDTVRDTGCSLRVMKREVALRLPLEFAGMHRFIPATARHMGYTVVEMPVGHRTRATGKTKYGFGITARAIPGLVDCLVVRYMRKRWRPVECEEIRAEGARERLADAGALAGSAP